MTDHLKLEGIRPGCFVSCAEWTEPTKEEVNILLDTLKKNRGMNQLAVAKMIGVLPRQVRRWAAGDSPIKYAEWALLCFEAGLGPIWHNSIKQCGT